MAAAAARAPVVSGGGGLKQAQLPHALPLCPQVSLLPVQTRPPGAASYREQARSRRPRRTVCPCAHSCHALSVARPSRTPKTLGWPEETRLRAAHQLIASLGPAPYPATRLRRSGTPPHAPRSRPSASEDGSDDTAKPHGGGLHFGAFLCPAEVIGWRGTKEAGRAAAGSVPPVEPGDAAQDLSLCFPSPASLLLL